MSLHYVAEAVTVLHWNRLSDHIGRKPVLLCCLAGTTISMVLFGFSRSFRLIVFRYLPLNADLRLCDMLTCLSQPLSAWRDEGKYRRREKRDGRTHGRNQHGARICIVASRLGRWLCDRVGHLTHGALSLLILRVFLAQWLAAPYRDRKIAGHTSFRTLCGPNILTCSHAW